MNSPLLVAFLLSIILRCSAAPAWWQKGQTLVGEGPGDNFGTGSAMSADGSVWAIGAYLNDDVGANSGSVRVFSSSTGSWVKMGQDLDGEAAEDRFGFFVALSSDGSVVASGSYQSRGGGAVGSLRGSARVFAYNSGSNLWVQRGANIDGLADSDLFGYSVALNSAGNILAVGAIGSDAAFADAGQVRVFLWSGTSWSMRGNILNGEAASDNFGYSVSLSADGSVLAVGAVFNDGNGANSGHVRVFTYNSGSNTWIQRGADVNGEAAGDQFGFAVVLSDDGSILAVSADFNDGVSGVDSGSIRVFAWSGTAWQQRGGDLDGEYAGDFFGRGLDISADGLVVAGGSPINRGPDSTATARGHIRVFSWTGSAWQQKGSDIDGLVADDRYGRWLALDSTGDFVGGTSWNSRASDSTATSRGTARAFQYVVDPTGQPSGQPTSQPSRQPSNQPTRQPSVQPSAQPTRQPSSQPSRQPSAQPSSQPTGQPSMQPYSSPSSQPSGQPSMQPTNQPIAQPTAQPSSQPSCQPSCQPTSQPSGQPTGQPFSQPSHKPSCQPTSQPSYQPTRQPTGEPSCQPYGKPSARPSVQPSSQPSVQPSCQPSKQPVSQPSNRPTGQPSSQPTAQPTAQPNGVPSVQPSRQPSSQPSWQPSNQPSSQPSRQPTSEPSTQPTNIPTSHPSGQPTNRPTSQPTGQPSTQPSGQPFSLPSGQPSSLPTTMPSCQPTVQPTQLPTIQPSVQPTSRPTAQPTTLPSTQPTTEPTTIPTGQPSSQPSSGPSSSPTALPSGQPSSKPSLKPSSQPSSSPSYQPSMQPTKQPSSQPSVLPTSQPSNRPTSLPSSQPSDNPSSQPSAQPTSIPTGQPSAQPSAAPSIQPSNQPTAYPSAQPSSQPTKTPSGQPSSCPSSQPSALPTGQPTAVPSCHPSAQPSSSPTSQPSSQPSRQPSVQPSCQPSGSPTSQPTHQPSSQPSLQPTSQPSVLPSCQPTTRPSVRPSGQPSISPSAQPSCQPSSNPSCQPTSQPSPVPSSQPSCQPTRHPSGQPSGAPSTNPSTQPTCQPSSQPSSQPSIIPTSQPSRQPTNQPSGVPTSQPSSHPSSQPSSQPSVIPTSQPSAQPSAQPSIIPTSQPSAQPSAQPTVHPSAQPTVQPTSQPTSLPSGQPSTNPSGQPSSTPSVQPSAYPSVQPSGQPSVMPTTQPTTQPTGNPSSQPSIQPSAQPSDQPSSCPSSQPTSQPTSVPSSQPSSQPSSIPTAQPSSQPSLVPSSQPSSQPSAAPSGQPTSQPSFIPTSQPSCQPSGIPSAQPSCQPSGIPSSQPSSKPSQQPSSEPTSQPSIVPTHQPSCQPTEQPTSTPSCQPSSQPSRNPSNQPTSYPSTQPTNQPSALPTSQPTVAPSIQPSSQPSAIPSSCPTSQPTNQPSDQPLGIPTAQPSSQPSCLPSPQPSAQPSVQPTSEPTAQPSSQPSSFPSGIPTSQPSSVPSCQPTLIPSSIPTGQPSSNPSGIPSAQPTCRPSVQPVAQPTAQPSCLPSCQPSLKPSSQPSIQPSDQPTMQPTIQPFSQPTTQPSGQPSRQPTGQPSCVPSSTPSSFPSAQPTRQPSSFPSRQPSSQPSSHPSVQPTSRPSTSPSCQPTVNPTSFPSARPSQEPSGQPTWQPSGKPTRQPSGQPSGQPSIRPSCRPSSVPSTTSALSNSALTNFSSLFGNAGAPVSLISDSFRIVSNTLTNITANQPISVAIPVTEQEQLLIDSGQLKLPTINLFPNNTGNLTVAVGLFNNALWNSSGNSQQPLTSDIIVVQASNGLRYVDIMFPISAIPISPPVNFTIVCRAGERKWKNYTCIDSGFVDYYQCVGVPGVYIGTCPVLQQSCSALDLTARALAAAGTGQSCVTLNETAVFLMCRCTLGNNALQADTGVVAAGVVLRFVGSDISNTFKAANALNSGGAASEASTMIILFSLLWGSAFLLMIFFGVRHVWKYDDDANKDYEEGLGRKKTVIGGLSWKRKRVRPNLADSTVVTGKKEKEYADTQLTYMQLMEYVDSIFPPVFAKRAVLKLVARELYHHHEYINLFFRLAERSDPILDVFKMISMQSYLLFLLALLYDLNYPDDDGSCQLNTSEQDCLRRTSLLDPAQTYCQWSSTTSASPIGGVTVEDGLCSYAQPRFSFNTAIYISTMIAFATCIYLGPLEYGMTLLAAPNRSAELHSMARSEIVPVEEHDDLEVCAVKDADSQSKSTHTVRQPTHTRLVLADVRQRVACHRRLGAEVEYLRTSVFGKGAKSPLLHRLQMLLNIKKERFQSRRQAVGLPDVDKMHTLRMDALEKELIAQLSLLDPTAAAAFCRSWGINDNRHQLIRRRHIYKKTWTGTQRTPVSPFALIQDELLSVESQVEDAAEELEGFSSDAEKGFELLHWFVVDLLGRHTAAARIFRLKAELEFEVLHGTSWQLKAMIVLLVLSLDGFFIYYAILKGFSKGLRWQADYVKAWGLQVGMDALLFETVKCLWFHVIMPRMVAKEVQVAYQTVQNTVQRLFEEETDGDVPNKAGSCFNAAEFFFVSTRLARARAQQDLLESIVVRAYSNHLPGAAALAWKAQVDLLSDPQAPAASVRLSCSVSSVVGLALLPLHGVQSAALSTIVRAPLAVQHVLIRMSEPLLLYAMTLAFLLVLDDPLLLGVVACGAVLVVGGLVWDSVRVRGADVQQLVGMENQPLSPAAAAAAAAATVVDAVSGQRDDALVNEGDQLKAAALASVASAASSPGKRRKYRGEEEDSRSHVSSVSSLRSSAVFCGRSDKSDSSGSIDGRDSSDSSDGGSGDAYRRSEGKLSEDDENTRNTTSSNAASARSRSHSNASNTSNTSSSYGSSESDVFNSDDLDDFDDFVDLNDDAPLHRPAQRL